MSKKYSILVALTAFFSVLYFIPAQSQQKGFGQENVADETEDSLFDDAEYYFNEKNFLGALPVYITLFKNYPGRLIYGYRLGICYLYKSDEVGESINLLEDVAGKDAEFEEALYYLARAYHLNYMFDKAIETLEKARKNKKLYSNKKKEIEKLTVACKNANEFMKNKIKVSVENIGRPINTEGSEYVPVITSDESVMIFTYKGPRSSGGKLDKYGRPDERGQYFEDIFISNRLGDSWLEPESIDENINSPAHDAAIALSSDGQKLFIYKDSEESSGDIYMSYLEGNVWSFPIPLGENINSKSWDGSASLSPDEKILYFVSDRSGGHGGRDIYISQRKDDATWGKAENIGPPVNTEENEDAPFIHPDGKTLFFSSEGLKNMGGYDIFKTIRQKDGKWSPPENIGYPINTPDDDKYYVEAANGARAYYSTGKVGSIGLQDIYVINWSDNKAEPAVALVKGIITANGRAVKGNITVNDITVNVVQGNYVSNAATGKYLINLPAGKNYKVTYEVETFPAQVRDVQLAEIDTFTEITIDIKLGGAGMDIEGKVFYNADTNLAAKDVTLFVFNPENAQLGKTVSNQFGQFKFTALPAIGSLSMDIDAQDPDLQADKKMTFQGRVTVNDSAKQGIAINGSGTDANGRFSFDRNPTVLTKLPEDLRKLDSLNLNDPNLFYKMLERFGNVQAEGMIFKVQLAAYFDPSKFNYKNLKELGEIKQQRLSDGITRFTTGDFTTLNQAEQLRKRAVAKGVADAFITVFYKGERKIWADVVRNNFYQNK